MFSFPVKYRPTGFADRHETFTECVLWVGDFYCFWGWRSTIYNIEKRRFIYNYLLSFLQKLDSPKNPIGWKTSHRPKFSTLFYNYFSYRYRIQFYFSQKLRREVRRPTKCAVQILKLISYATMMAILQKISNKKK